MTQKFCTISRSEPRPVGSVVLDIGSVVSEDEEVFGGWLPAPAGGAARTANTADAAAEISNLAGLAGTSVSLAGSRRLSLQIGFNFASAVC
jgi:hypothetical protein